MRRTLSSANEVEIGQHFALAAKRPTKRKPRKADCRVTVRFSPEERAQLQKEAGAATVSEHIRWCTLKKNSRGKRSTPLKNQETLAQILGQLGQSRMASNLNQLAYHANAGSLLLDEETLQKIEEAYVHICSMRRDLIAALGLRERRDK